MIVWKAATVSPRMASFRYRVALPALYLEARGLRSRMAWHPRMTSLRGAEAIVFSKTFAAGDLALARRARRRGIPIIYDLCDNVFVDGYPVRAPAIFGQIAALASLIVTTTPALADVISRHVGAAKRIVVIPDPVEAPEDALEVMARVRFAAAVESILRRLNAARTRARATAVTLAKLALTMLGRRPPVQARAAPGAGMPPVRVPISPARTQGDAGAGSGKLITWFGNHGGDYSDFGMLDILAVAPALEALATRHAIRLRVVSNNYAKFAEKIAPLRLPTEYVEWTPHAAHRLVRQSDVVIVPSTLNDFTRCKSANRLLLALNCGVPVVATRTPASAEFEGCVLFEDWERNIERYLTDSDLRKSHLERALALIESRYLPQAIAERWQAAIEEAKAQRPAARYRIPAEPRLVLLVNLVQDLELVLPVYDSAKLRPRWRAEIWVTTHDLLSRAEMWRRLEAAGVPYHVVEARHAESGGFPDWEGVAALVSASESTAAPHRHAMKAVRIARRHGVRTYTLQHGFQNVGLTYEDEHFPISRIRFASDVIFLWGTQESLHPGVAPETREKCVPIGCPKPIDGSTSELPRRFAEPVVAVFENLHSPRYEGGYAQRFLDDLFLTMKQRPDLRFLIKPHPAGQYLTTRHGAPVELPDNAVLVDPRAKEWLNVSAADLLAQAAAVITSVTTVAFDAARFGKPVAVAAKDYTRDLSAFLPLTQLRTQGDWGRFLKSAIDERDAQLVELSRAFARKTVLEGDAIRRILDYVDADMRAAAGAGSATAAGK
jgi:glycosyltransferase involved in cell wall biosynthesis